MLRSVDRMVSNIREAEEELSRDVHAQQRRWRYRVRRGRVWFDEEVKRAHSRLKQSVPGFIRHGSLLNLLTAPMIGQMVVNSPEITIPIEHVAFGCWLFRQALHESGFTRNSS